MSAVQLPLYHHFSILDSTNTRALLLAKQGAKHGTVVHADRQSSGRGRGERTFISPRGGLYFSLLVRPVIAQKILPLITLAAGVGLCEGLKQAVDGLQIQLKWPNDLYLNGRKLGGILTESGPIRRDGSVPFVIIGAGINLHAESEQFPSELRKKIIVLAEVMDREIRISSLLPLLVNQLERAIQRLCRGNKTAVLAEWRSLDYLQGRLLQYHGPNKIIAATGVGLADDGRYGILDHQGMTHYITAGEMNPIKPVL